MSPPTLGLNDLLRSSVGSDGEGEGDGGVAATLEARLTPDDPLTCGARLRVDDLWVRAARSLNGGSRIEGKELERAINSGGGLPGDVALAFPLMLRLDLV